ncbi:SH3 domain-containing protein [Paenibacillus elgii]|uniref:SH3b domain-containing protein n=1 Tax=Paenibacillus elgii TaxID=189691 RepID=A0A165QFZ4_9BACL|nr:SH3 domain-containing protein [Paenibacillus elgii]KZE74814.1 hypothetical protein AV654_28100 [Paenibacillus elgii]NEN85601.1 SH3 domain-containing protein [Paenibacillus elgii]
MMKKLIAASLIATAVLPATGAFAAENTVSVQQSSTAETASHAIESGTIALMTSTYSITGDGVRFRASASSSGTVLGTLNKGDLVNGGNETKNADGITWVSVYSYKYNKWGWVASQYLEEVG